MGEPFASGGDSPTGLATDSTGRFLFAANTFSSNVSVLRIGANGVLSPVSGSPFAYAANGNATGIVFLEAPGFDIFLQDDSNSNMLLFNSTTGDYQFTRCSSGLLLGGTGILTRKGNLITLQHTTADRRVLAQIDNTTKRATASVQVFSQGTTFTITDRNTTNNACSCP